MPSKHKSLIIEEYQGYSTSKGVELVMTLHPQMCLVLFTKPRWEHHVVPFIEKEGESIELVRWYYGNAEMVIMDPTGRVLITPELRHRVGISKEVTLLGLGTSFEIWDKTQFHERETVIAQSQLSDKVNALPR
ncbi:MAG: hypothetical protein QM520_03390 [Gammaproteobacteria bacterium]|nr:hypothetical protein [Gammaproteobacteria bacterium]